MNEHKIEEYFIILINRQLSINKITSQWEKWLNIHFIVNVHVALQALSPALTEHI